MKASELVKELKEIIDKYGDYYVDFRESDDNIDVDIGSVYFDEEAERVIISDFFS